MARPEVHPRAAPRRDGTIPSPFALTALAALLVACPSPTLTVQAPTGSITAEPCTLAGCGPDDRVVTVRGTAVGGAIVTAIDVARTLPDGELFQASTTATNHFDVDAGSAPPAESYEIVLAPRRVAGELVAPRRGDAIRVWQLLDDGVHVRRSNPSDLELRVP